MKENHQQMKKWRGLARHTVAAAVLALGVATMMPQRVNAQLSSNPDKFLGNITTGNNQVDWGSEPFHTLWNQITPENATKWDACEPSRGNFTFGGADQSANYAAKWGFPFKFHTLIWGAQYPGWVNNLSTAEQTKAITEWYDGVKAHYPNLEIIDVVNEAIAGHQPAPYRAVLGGEGKTGYDWIIRAFEMAHERWPDAILVYNDFNTFRWQKSEFIDLVRTLRDAGAPIDAYGCQSHDLTDMSVSDFKSAMTEIQNALKMPMYSTEYDIGTNDDALQKQRYQEQIPYMWEADYCAGVTLWGYIYGQTWTGNENDGTKGNSGLIRDNEDRPAMEWLRTYMASEAAKTAKSPFPGMKKEASLYIKPTPYTPTKGEPMTITVNARLRTKTIDHIDLYVKGTKFTTLTEAASVNEKTLDAAYEAQYTPTATGKHSLRAVLYDTEGTKYERLGSFTAFNPRSPFRGEIELPGTVEVENFDVGGEGLTFHDSDTKNEGTTAYRTNGGGVDIVSGNGNYAIGYTAAGEWLEYTVNVTKAGTYAYDAYVSAGGTGAAISLSLDTDGTVQNITDNISIPQTGSNTWDNYVPVHGRTLVELPEGKHILRLNITGGNGNVDKVVFRHIEPNTRLSLTLRTTPTAGTVGEDITLRAASVSAATQSVSFYVNNVLVKTVTEAPYETTYRPTAKGTYTLTAESTDADGKTSKVFKTTFKVNNKRAPYTTTPVSLPGTIQAERFDKGGEGLSFHDSDTKAEGDGSSYRADAEGVDIVKISSGYVIGYTAAGEWLDYSVNVKQPGKYTYEATVSSGTTGSGFRIYRILNGKQTTLANITVPKTGDNTWDTYQTITGDLLKDLEEGEQIIRFYITGANCNIDKVKFNCVINTDIEDLTAPDKTPVAIYNLAGQKVDENYRGIIIRNGKKYMRK